jgi:hypothetical protein
MNKRNSRDLFPSHNVAGKGDKDRTSNLTAFKRNYDEIDWGSHRKKKILFLDALVNTVVDASLT